MPNSASPAALQLSSPPTGRFRLFYDEIVYAGVQQHTEGIEIIQTGEGLPFLP